MPCRLARELSSWLLPVACCGCALLFLVSLPHSAYQAAQRKPQLVTIAGAEEPSSLESLLPIEISLVPWGPQWALHHHSEALTKSR